MKMIAMGDFLTDSQIKKLLSIWDKDREHFHDRAVDEVLRPAIADINKKLGQDNDPRYLAYAVEYVFTFNKNIGVAQSTELKGDA